ncbi:hypothetical protein [Amycolatopsis sp. NPDC051903]
MTLGAGDSGYSQAGRRHRFADLGGGGDAEVITVLSQGSLRDG